MKKDRNGIRILDNSNSPEMKRGRNIFQDACPHVIRTSSRERTGATLGIYRDIWPSVKWVSTLGR